MSLLDPSLLRLVAVPLFAWAAYHDRRTHRVPSKIWKPIFLIGTVAGIWELLMIFPEVTLAEAETVVKLFVVPFFIGLLGIGLSGWGVIGTADAKALTALGVAFPLYPAFVIQPPITGGWIAMPAVHGGFEFFPFAVVVNAIILMTAYPIGWGIKNLSEGTFNPRAIVNRRVDVETALTKPGQVRGVGRDTVDSLDLDAVRMYLRWRGIDIDDLRGHGEVLKNPATITETYDPTDGAIRESVSADVGQISRSRSRVPPENPAPSNHADPWGVEAFLEEVEHAYGTEEDELRAGLDYLTAADTVWVSPGIPFVVPLLAGLLCALTVGDLFMVAWLAVGLPPWFLS